MKENRSVALTCDVESLLKGSDNMFCLAESPPCAEIDYQGHTEMVQTCKSSPNAVLNIKQTCPRAMISDANNHPEFSLIHFFYTHLPLFNKLRNSSLVFALLRMHPSIQLVDVELPAFSTPRITMQRCELSITTATPCGLSTSEMASATCFVSRSWTWRRRENISARRASLERPMTLRSGM